MRIVLAVIMVVTLVATQEYPPIWGFWNCCSKPASRCQKACIPQPKVPGKPANLLLQEIIPMAVKMMKHNRTVAPPIVQRHARFLEKAPTPQLPQTLNPKMKCPANNPDLAAANCNTFLKNCVALLQSPNRKRSFENHVPPTIPQLPLHCHPFLLIHQGIRHLAFKYADFSRKYLIESVVGIAMDTPCIPRALNTPFLENPPYTSPAHNQAQNRKITGARIPDMGDGKHSPMHGSLEGNPFVLSWICLGFRGSGLGS